jgi:hypothetical protein
MEQPSDKYTPFETVTVMPFTNDFQFQRHNGHTGIDTHLAQLWQMREGR